MHVCQTQILRDNINDQLNRLLTQLEDLDELKDGHCTAQRTATPHHNEHGSPTVRDVCPCRVLSRGVQ